MQSFTSWLSQLSFSYIWDYVVIVAASLVCIMFHEVSHGVVALKLGDPTAKNAGRLTFNPIKHVDIWGLVINEAMAYCLPIVTTDNCIAGVELVPEDCIIPTNDSEALGEKIEELFKLFLVPPRHFVNGISYYAFHSVSIFTPKPGLFDETPPQ